MGKKDLSLFPQHFGSSDYWYYEGEKGIEFVDSKSSKIIVIPWRKLKASLKRLEK
jgi:hypothetical protein